MCVGVISRRSWNKANVQSFVEGVFTGGQKYVLLISLHPYYLLIDSHHVYRCISVCTYLYLPTCLPMYSLHYYRGEKIRPLPKDHGLVIDTSFAWDGKDAVMEMADDLDGMSLEELMRDD